MFTTTILLTLLASLTTAIPNPNPQAAATTDLGSSPTSFSIPTDLGGAASSFSYDSASEASLLSQESAYLTLFSGIPTLPASVESVLATAVPVSELSTYQCETELPAWYSSLPADVKSALTSYEVAVESWLKVHSSDLAQFTSGITGVPTVPVCTGGAVQGGSVSKGSTAKSTNAASTPKASGSGSGAGASGSSAGAASASGSKAAAAMAKPTGALAIGAAGVAGVLGLLVAL